MRDDGQVSIFIVQHQQDVGGGDKTWVKSSLDYLLFDGLPFKDRRGARGQRYHALIEPTHECWQQTGFHDFLDIVDAIAAYEALRERRPTTLFRVVKRQVQQQTQVVHG